MKIAVICVLFSASLLHAFTIPANLNQAAPADLDKVAPPDLNQVVQPDGHKIDKRFITSTMLLMDALLDDDDYFDDFPLLGRRRRPSRRTVQLAQMLRQLAGPQGLTRGQMQNIQQNLQNLQVMQNVQQITQLQNLQSGGAQPQAG